MLQPVGLGLERGEEGAELQGRLPKSQLDIAQLVPGSLQLGGEVLERSDRPLRDRDETGRSFGVLGCEGFARCCDAGRELGHMSKALALLPQGFFGAAVELFRVLDERA